MVPTGSGQLHGASPASRGGSKHAAPLRPGSGFLTRQTILRVTRHLGRGARNRTEQEHPSGSCSGEVGSGSGLLRFLGNRSVKIKILASVLTVAFMGIGVTVFGMSRMSDLNDQMTTSRDNSRKIQSLALVRDAVDQASLDVLGILLSVDATSRTSGIALFQTTGKRVGTAISTYRATGLDEKQEKKLTEFQNYWESFSTLTNDKLIPRSLQNPSATAEIRSKEIEPAAAMMDTILQDLVAISSEEVDQQESIANDVYSTARFWMLLIQGIGLALGLALAVFISRLVTCPLARCVATLRTIATGDLTARAPVEYQDEIGQLASQLNGTVEAVGAMVRGVASNAERLSATSAHLSSTALQLSGSSEETAAKAGSASEIAEHVSQSIQSIAEGARGMGQSIKEIATNAGEAAQVASGASTTAQRVNDIVLRLGQSSSEIDNVIKMITTIAGQTHLLALNATIEAARAGDAGLGFAVVAEEVKQLAHETATATEDISQRISAIQAETKEAISTIGEISKIIEMINEYSTTIAAAVQEQETTTSETSRNVNEAATGSSDIVTNITSVAEAAGSTASGAVATQAAAQELAELASELRHTVEGFRV
ncbi:MAG: Chemotaxis protein [Actinomycetota bacterium]|nr:Chemotaxis protein [Actinomycetota bacterium]